ncbi:hypothetical protein TRFO_13270 [Tritrichomonas foetus]|uniref:Uncharacterized protein n=1 Tax=Tritrichomonas foetus TaxID=1144522 RepID=A0A1J4KYD2_9EUKA|nr:hypothetical protein TRFO_13270 [Tritrichomonas foetus]|eukprot:OHT16265.1 hypothetical protein TRFO_13270 [Tritrichomonas foetus]
MLFIFFSFFSKSETVNIYSQYSSTYENLCENFVLNSTGLFRNGTRINETFHLSSGTYADWTTADGQPFYFDVQSCNIFHWGMATSNNNPFILEPNGILRIWVDDATSISDPLHTSPNTISRKLTSMIHSMGNTPSIHIYDAMTSELCFNFSEIIYDDKNNWWETIVNCDGFYYFRIDFDDLTGFFSPTGDQPVVNTNVFPPLSPFFKSNGKYNYLPDLKNTVKCPCRPPLNLAVQDSQIYISPSNHHNYTILQGIDNVQFAGFLDNSIIFYSDGQITIQNFYANDQQISFKKELTNIATPKHCSFSNFWQNGRGYSAIISWDKNQPSLFYLINLTDSPKMYEKSLSDDKIIDVQGTMSSKNIFYFLSEKEMNNIFISIYSANKDEFIERENIPGIDKNAKIHWSPFGYIFILSNSTIKVSSDSHLHFSNLEFADENENDQSGHNSDSDYSNNLNITFAGIYENKKGYFLASTEEGFIYFFSLDSPQLSRLQVRMNYEEDTITVDPDKGTFSLIDSHNYVHAIPLESEISILKRYNKLWMKTICPKIISVEKNLPSGNIIMDKRDVLTFTGSIYSDNGQRFVIRSDPTLSINVTTSKSNIVQLQPQNNQFVNLQVQKFNITFHPGNPGVGRLLIHTTSPSWLCNFENIVRDVVVGCPSSKELRIRGGSNITQFYTNPYIRPIIDIYQNNEFIEEYTGNFTVETNYNIDFVISGNNIINKTNKNQIRIREFNKNHVMIIRLLDDSWSFCNLSVTAYITVYSPDRPYYSHFALGLFFYLILMVLVLSVTYYQTRNHKITNDKMNPYSKLD